MPVLSLMDDRWAVLRVTTMEPESVGFDGGGMQVLVSAPDDDSGEIFVAFIFEICDDVDVVIGRTLWHRVTFVQRRSKGSVRERVYDFVSPTDVP